MYTIWKFPLPNGPDKGGENTVDIPKHAQILRGAVQGGVATLWCLVDSKAETEPRSFFISGTGQPLPAKAEYVASYDDGQFVWHLFERIGEVWHEWSGGDCPVFGTMVVDYRQRNGKLFSAPAAALHWPHDGDESDIVAYRIADEQPEI